MNEGMRNLAVLVWALCAINNNSYASDNKMIIAEESAQNAPTIIYGASRKSNGEKDEVVVEQPEGAPNPLGDPIVPSNPTANPTLPAEKIMTAPEAAATKPELPVVTDNKAALPVENTEVNGENSVQNLQKLGKDFQNTLLESDGMVYDVQAYPEEDLKAIGNPSNPATLYSPNVNP